LRRVAVLLPRRATTNTSSSVPFAETSYTAENTLTLEPAGFSRMRNRLVKRERSCDMVARPSQRSNRDARRATECPHSTLASTRHLSERGVANAMILAFGLQPQVPIVERQEG